MDLGGIPQMRTNKYVSKSTDYNNHVINSGLLDYTIAGSTLPIGHLCYQCSVERKQDKRTKYLWTYFKMECIGSHRFSTLFNQAFATSEKL